MLLEKLTLFRIGFFSGLLTNRRGGGGGGGLFDLASLKSVRHPTMMKLGTVIPYLRKIRKINRSHDTSLEFC